MDDILKDLGNPALGQWSWYENPFSSKLPFWDSSTLFNMLLGGHLLMIVAYLFGFSFVLLTGKIAFIHRDLIGRKHCSRY